MTEDRVGASVAMKIQVQQYEPVEVSAWAELSVIPEDSSEPASVSRKKAWDRCWQEVSQQLVDGMKDIVKLYREVREQK